MADRDRSGLTRRELFKGVGAGALVGAVATGAARSGEAARAGGGATVVGPGATSFELSVNGQARKVTAEPRATLLDVLRDHLELTGAKPVCDRGACGACTVHLDGKAICACMLLALDAVGREVTTVEGLAHGDALSPLQAAFVEHDALQCGFCTPGMLMSCAALLAENAKPTLGDVKHAVAGNLCRCGTYPKVFEATLAVASRARGGGGEKAGS